jgi:hypothetical protein
MTMFPLRLFAMAFSSILLLPAMANSESATPDALISRVIGDVNHATFRLDITERLEKFSTHTPAKTTRHKLKTPDFLPVRTVEIECTSGCSKKVRFTEDLADVPLGAFRLWDGTSQFVTIWGGATAYWVRIYNVDQSGVKKVFEEATKSAPQFGFAADSSPVVVLNDPTSTVKSGFATHGRVWKWSGERYQAVSGLVEGR